MKIRLLRLAADLCEIAFLGLFVTMVAMAAQAAGA